MKNRLFVRVLSYFFSKFKVDWISMSKIHGRPDLVELGTDYGGWVVPSELLFKKAVCYCAGCGEDISFDLALIDSYECDVYAFDPTPRSIEYVRNTTATLQGYRFFEVGLWDKKEKLKFFVPSDPDHVSHSLLNLQRTDSHILVDVERLSVLMKKLGHKRIDLLKLDIEGAEYRVLGALLEDELDVKVLCVEFDECFNPLDRHYVRRIRNAVSKLKKNGYFLVNVQDYGNYTFVKR